MILELLCNNERNGIETGYCESIRIQRFLKKTGFHDICHIDGDPAHKIRCSVSGKLLKLGRLKINIKWYTKWFGNWCWDACTISWKDTKRVLRYLKKNKYWYLDEARSHFERWYNSK